MKKLSIIAMVCALLLTLSQGKKNETTTDGGEKVYVSVKIANGAKHEVNPETGVVTFAEGDVVHVASAGVYLGTLTYDGTQFSGDINEPTEGQKLQFYFLGNVTPDFNADNSQCSVVISDQTEHLPVISAAPSVEDYTAGLTNYTATLLHKCALVKFDVTTSSTAAICMKDFKNKVTLNFATNTFAYSKDGDGVITLPAGSGEQWAILLPQPAMTAGNIGYAYSVDGRYTGSRGAVPAIYENGYFTVGIPVEVDIHLVPEGAASGLFTYDGAGNQTYIATGNLQYQASTNTWRIAEHPWDVVGEGNTNISPTYDGWIDLFGWGTSGYNNGQVCYQPYSTSTNTPDYRPSQGWLGGTANWGYTPIVNGGNTENSGWWVPNASQWDYVTRQRQTPSGLKSVGAYVNGIGGLIMLPDDWEPSFYALTNSYSFWTNNITAEDWTNCLEAHGAVFLPVTGYRDGISWIDSDKGYYWSCGYGTSNWSAYVLYFTSGDYNAWGSYHNLHRGTSVRLFHSVD